MPYYSQSRNDIRCGAYTIAYWIWNIRHKSVDSPITDQEKAQVADIYRQVKFTESDLYNMGRGEASIASQMNGFSNPYRMRDYIRSNLKEKVTVATSDANMHLLLQVLNPEQSKEQLHDLIKEESAILVMHNKANMPQHYIYAVGQANGLITIIDPVNGIPLENQANLNGLIGCVVNELFFKGTVIY